MALFTALQPTFSISHKTLTKFPIPKPFCFHRFKSVSNSMADSSEKVARNCPSTGENYPVPLSPPLAAISKNLELARAMAASSKSSLFALSANDVIYEDEWLIAVNKPQGIYCESVLAAVPRLLGDSAMAGLWILLWKRFSFQTNSNFNLNLARWIQFYPIFWIC